MQIFINDKTIECAPGSTLMEILEAQHLPTGNVAIAMNFAVVPRGEWATTILQDGSKIIIIKAVQGG